jgi:glycosyltransferase involved in cell wall biosynthesis
MKSARILLLSGMRGDTRRYRSLHLAEQFRLLGLETLICHITDSGLMQQIEKTRFAVAFLHRVAMDPYLARILKILHQQDAVILYDTDDLIFDSEAIRYIDRPDLGDALRHRLYRDKIERQREALRACQASVASTDFLAGRIADLGLPVFVHRNAFSFEMKRLSEKAIRRKTFDRRRCVIGYASGTNTHDKDFAIVVPVLRTLMHQYPQIDLHLIGPLNVGLGWDGLRDRMKHTPLVPWRKLPTLLADFDINLAPLLDNNSFSRSKSAIKYMEAALVQTPTVASTVDAFERAIEDGENGCLADMPETWMKAIKSLLLDPERRIRMGKAAAKAVEGMDSPQKRAEALSELLDRVFQTLREHRFWESAVPRQPKMDSEFNQNHLDQVTSPSNLRLGLYTLRWQGLWPFLAGVWVWVRRVFSPIFPFRLRD